MADESPGAPAAPPSSSAPGAAAPLPVHHGPLGWIIRLTGFILMLGSLVYLGISACDPLMGRYQRADLPYLLIISLIKLGFGILALRIGLRMLLLVDAATIRQFSFIFALFLTYALVRFMPLSNVLQGNPVLFILLLGLCVCLSYWVLSRILVFLIFPPAKS